MDTKLKSDIAESAVTTELLSRGFNVLKPVGDRLAYDLAIDSDGCLLRIQVKAAWHSQAKDMYIVDTRRTKTNRRRMKREKYTSADFDFAILYVPEKKIFYIMPVEIFTSYASCISLVEEGKRQRPPRSRVYRERWDLLNEH